MHDKAPERFHFTLHDDIAFNHSIIIDLTYLTGDPVLRVYATTHAFDAGASIKARYNTQKKKKKTAIDAVQSWVVKTVALDGMLSQ